MMAKKDKKSNNEKLQEKIFLDKKSSWFDLNKNEVFKFVDSYKKFLGKSKTERLCAENIIKELEKKGFKEISTLKVAKTGDKI